MYKLVYLFLAISTAKSLYDEDFWSDSKIVYKGHAVSIEDLSAVDESIVYEIQRLFDDNGTLPKEWDWRNESVIPQVVDERQYYNGYSWAFSAVAGMTSHTYILTNRTEVSLSVQNLVDCVDFDTEKPLRDLRFVFNYLIDNGTANEDDYPLTGGKGSCNQKDKTTDLDFYMGVVNEEHMQRCIGNGGPVNALIDASNLTSYTGGIIDSSWCSNNTPDGLNQAVLVVGYGTENGIDYWIIQNSWGESWGENGYFRLQMNDNNTCGIGLIGIYPGVLATD